MKTQSREKELFQICIAVSAHHLQSTLFTPKASQWYSAKETYIIEKGFIKEEDRLFERLHKWWVKDHSFPIIPFLNGQRKT